MTGLQKMTQKVTMCNLLALKAQGSIGKMGSWW